MTSNQVAYWNMRELQRSNLAKEAIQRGQLQETARSNRKREQLTEMDVRNQNKFRNASIVTNSFNAVANLTGNASKLLGLFQ